MRHPRAAQRALKLEHPVGALRSQLVFYIYDTVRSMNGSGHERSLKKLTLAQSLSTSRQRGMAAAAFAATSMWSTS
jgi:hypothetical protein